MNHLKRMDANITSDLFLEFNRKLVEGRLPLITVNIILFVVGFVGNVLVICVYNTRLKRGRGRFYIPYLAMSDLCSITVSCAVLTLMDVTEAMFPSEKLCKFIQFLNWACVQNSIFLLFVIALHRYLIICHPFRSPLVTIGERKMLVLVVAFLSVITSAPVVIFNSGIRTFPCLFDEQVIYGAFCSFNTKPQDQEQYLWFIFVLNILVMIITTVLYIPIGKTVFSTSVVKYRKKSNIRSCHAQSKCYSKPVSSYALTSNELQTGELAELKKKIDLSTERESNLFRHIIRGNLESENSSDILQNTEETQMKNKVQQPGGARKFSRHMLNGHLTDEHSCARVRKRGKSARRKFTVTFLAVIIFYVISFIPFYVIVLNDMTNLGRWYDLRAPPYKINGFLFIHRSYMLNNVMDPIIYSLFDAVFRRELIKMISNWIGSIRLLTTKK